MLNGNATSGIRGVSASFPQIWITFCFGLDQETEFSQDVESVPKGLKSAEVVVYLPTACPESRQYLSPF
jgi:hypothetical protein